MNDTRYHKEHLWLRLEEGTTALVGVSQYAQEQLGDIMFVELPPIGTALICGQSFGSIESVKTASELIAPASGVVTQVNEALRDEPWQVNDAPLEGGFILKMQCKPEEEGELMDEEAYRRLTGSE